MVQSCERSFGEEQLSGYLDHALPQIQAQKIRIHLEDCGTCRSLYEELQTLRDASRSTSFPEPEDDDWPELPKTPISRFSRSLGWTVMMSWIAIVTGVALREFFSQTGDPLEIFLVLGLPGGFILLFLSVLFDRLHDLKTDRYQGVHK